MTAAEALAEVVGALARSCPEGWATPTGAAVMGSRDLPTFNRVVALTDDPPLVSSLVDRVGDLPFLVETPAAMTEVAAWCADRGLRRTEGIPLMVADSASVVVPETPGVRWCEGDLDRHVEVAAEAFGMAVASLEILKQARVFGTKDGSVLVAEVDGEAAATGVGVRSGDWVGVFVVGTVEAHRRMGLGAAVTARLVRDSGAACALLQSSEVGYRVYESLGFRTVDRWTRWTTR